MPSHANRRNIAPLQSVKLILDSSSSHSHLQPFALQNVAQMLAAAHLGAIIIIIIIVIVIVIIIVIISVIIFIIIIVIISVLIFVIIIISTDANSLLRLRWKRQAAVP